MRKYKIVTCYDGTNYCGWQRQPNGLSIQEEIENILLRVTREHISIVGASRTDAGVHALEQVAHFTLSKELSLEGIRKSLNALLPPSIRILSLMETPINFHARYDAKKKRYRYRLATSSVLCPFLYPYGVHYTYPLNTDLMQKAATLCVGKKDFRGFSNEGFSTYLEKNTVRTLYQLSIEPTDIGLDFIYIGNGFLYKMVRNLTGTLLDIGRGKISIDHLQEIFSSKDRKKAGFAAPAKGLTLEKIFY